jgi:hypothetical protein
MVAFKNLSGIVALSIMTASILGAAAPTPSPENTVVSDLLNSLLGENEGSSLQTGVGTIKNIQGTVSLKAPPKDVELKARADFLGRADEEQAAEEDKNAEDYNISERIRGSLSQCGQIGCGKQRFL